MSCYTWYIFYYTHVFLVQIIVTETSCSFLLTFDILSAPLNSYIIVHVRPQSVQLCVKADTLNVRALPCEGKHVLQLEIRFDRFSCLFLFKYH